MPTPKNPPEARKPRKNRRPSQADLTEEAAPATGGVVGIKPPVVQTDPLTMLVVYPDKRWGVIAGLVVPICSALPFVNGANNVEFNDQTKRWDISRAKADIEKRGGIVIPFEVDGEGTSYVRRIKNHGGWIFRWQRVYAGSAQIDTDEKAYATWLRSLIERGVLPDPPAYAVQALLSELHARRSALIAAGRDKYAPKLEKIDGDIKAAELELTRVERLVEAEAEAEVPEVDGGAPAGL